MRKRKRREFDQDFKKETVRLIEEKDQAIAEVARKFNVHYNTIRRWIKELGTGKRVLPIKGKQIVMSLILYLLKYE